MTVECPLCKRAVFCSQECKIDKRGLFTHLEKHCEHGVRKVIEGVVDAIQHSAYARRYLGGRYAQGVKQHGPGMMHVVVHDVETTRVMLKSSVTDIGVFMSSSAFFTPLAKLSPTLRTRGKALLEEEDKESENPYFLLSVRAERHGSVIHKVYV